MGERGRLIADEALAAGMAPEDGIVLDAAGQAIDVLEETIRANDVVLIKGSRGIALDEVVAALARRHNGAQL